MLGTLRLLFKDAVQMERLEYGEATEIIEDAGATVADEVDEMIRKVYGRCDGRLICTQPIPASPICCWRGFRSRAT